MRFIADDLIPVPIDAQSHYECAVTALRTIAAEGFAKTDETFPPGQRQDVFIGKNRKPLVHLLEAAMQEVDPESCAYYNEDKGIMQLEFSASFEKPPIRQVWAKLDGLRNTLMRQTKLDEKSGYYIVTHDPQCGLSLCQFSAMFASKGHEICYYYRLPDNGIFIDPNGERHSPGSLVDFDIMEQYIEAHPDLGLSLNTMIPDKVAIDNHTMQLVMDAIGVSQLQKGAARN